MNNFSPFFYLFFHALGKGGCCFTKIPERVARDPHVAAVANDLLLLQQCTYVVAMILVTETPGVSAGK